MTAARLAEAEARLAAITPGAWGVYGGSKGEHSFWVDNNAAPPYVDKQLSYDTFGDGGFLFDLADAEFIAHAPEDLRLALAALKRVLDLAGTLDDDVAGLEHGRRALILAAIKGEGGEAVTAPVYRLEKLTAEEVRAARRFFDLWERRQLFPDGPRGGFNVFAVDKRVSHARGQARIELMQHCPHAGDRKKDSINGKTVEWCMDCGVNLPVVVGE